MLCFVPHTGIHGPLITDGLAVLKGSLGSHSQPMCSPRGPVIVLCMCCTTWTTRRFPLQGRSPIEISPWENLRSRFSHEKATTGEEGGCMSKWVVNGGGEPEAGTVFIVTSQVSTYRSNSDKLGNQLFTCNDNRISRYLWACASQHCSGSPAVPCCISLAYLPSCLYLSAHSFTCLL